GATSLVFASDKAHGGSIGFNVGSTYKLFTLLEWLEQGHSVNEVLNGNARVFKKFTACENTITNNDMINNSGKNRGYSGTIMEFTRRSLNTGYLAMAEQLDLCNINAMAERLGVKLGNGGNVT